MSEEGRPHLRGGDGGSVKPRDAQQFIAPPTDTRTVRVSVCPFLIELLFTYRCANCRPKFLFVSRD
jgi:hypothetical protein